MSSAKESVIITDSLKMSVADILKDYQQCLKLYSWSDRYQSNCADSRDSWLIDTAKDYSNIMPREEVIKIVEPHYGMFAPGETLREQMQTKYKYLDSWEIKNYHY